MKTKKTNNRMLQLGIKMPKEELDRLHAVTGHYINFSAFAREKIMNWVKEQEAQKQKSV